MKKLSILLLATVLIVACSKDNQADLEQSSKTPQVEADLSKMIPAAEFDISVNGMYAGIITTYDRVFHGKVWINVGNDGNYKAFTRSKNDKASFDLVSQEGDIYTFSGVRGSFIFNLSDLSHPIIQEATFDGGHADIVVSKEIGGAKFGIVLGTYTEGDLVTLRGTWDYIINTVTGVDFIDQTIIQLPLPFTGVKTESASDGDFETGNVGCYADNPPFFLSSSVPAAPTDELIELYLIGQSLPFPTNGTTVVYDVGFSKAIADGNGLDYNRMLCYPESTVDFIFAPGTIPVGQCTNITFGGPVVHGVYVELLDADNSVVSIGAIVIDTSTFVPFIPPPSSFKPTPLPTATATVLPKL